MLPAFLGATKAAHQVSATSLDLSAGPSAWSRSYAACLAATWVAVSSGAASIRRRASAR